MTPLAPSDRAAFAAAVNAHGKFGVSSRGNLARPVKFRLRVRFLDETEGRDTAALLGTHLGIRVRAYVDKAYRDRPTMLMLEVLGPRAVDLLDEIIDHLDDSTRERATAALDGLDEARAIRAAERGPYDV